MQKGGGGEGVQIACKVAYVINGRPLSYTVDVDIFACVHIGEWVISTWV